MTINDLGDVRPDRRLLVSVFDAREAREAVAGGARIIDSEDPRSALGTIKPRHIRAVADAVASCHRPLPVRLSTNIGEDQLLYRRTSDGQALRKSRYETAGKSAQAACGVAMAMGTHVSDTNIVKVGLDGMRPDETREVLQEIVATLRESGSYTTTRVMAVFFAQDLDLWEARRSLEPVRRELLALGEYHPALPDASDVPDDSDAFDLADHADALATEAGQPLFASGDHPGPDVLVKAGALPDGVRTTRVVLNDLFRHGDHGWTTARRTDREAVVRMVDTAAAAGAHGIMLDTSILLKAARVSLVSTADSELVDTNAADLSRHGLPRVGLLGLEELRFFTDYAHHRGLEANLAGSVQSHQAQQLWHHLPDLDQLSARGSVAAPDRDPLTGTRIAAGRHQRVVSRHLVVGCVPPEHGGAFVLPPGLPERDGELLTALGKRYPDTPLRRR
ncbi:(5-formylfuran-3-yl)methyl phosphate synthase [Streptomyces sp. NPDC000410]|uniref:(5-formylfuran-3-yl)methyl phosphate synthase n=1 Tax=Streptomyces sp. NPDC000410 TaxID=3154254 RepID=UPI0033229AFC